MGSLELELQKIKKTLDRLTRHEMPIVGPSGVVPAAGTQYNHLEDTGAAWASVTDVNMNDDAFLYFGANQDTSMVYDEAVDDLFKVDGADWLMENLILNIGTVGGGGEPLAVRIDQNANTGIELVNANAGAAATALARFKNTAGVGGDHALDVGVLGTGFTTSGVVHQDGGLIQTGANINALTIRTIADVSMYLATAATTVNMQLSSGGTVVNPTPADLDYLIKSNMSNAFFVQGSDGKVLFNTATEDANILATTLVQVIDSRLAVSQDGTSNSIDVYAYGAASVPKITFKTAGGTRAAPSAALSGTYLGAFDFTGYGAAFYDSGGAQIFGQASENWAVGNRGANLGFSTTPNGSAGGSIRAMIQNSGEFDIVEYLRHYGDTDTYRRFQTNQITDVAGGTSFIDMASATGLITLGGTGMIVPDDYYIGLGAAAGRIEFDNQAEDEVNILAANVGMGTNAPAVELHVYDASAACRLRLEAAGDDSVQFQLDSNSVRKGIFGYSAAEDCVKLNHSETGVGIGDDQFVINEGSIGIGTPTPGSLTEWNFADDDLEFVDAHAATGVGSINAVVECQIGGVTTYLVGYNSYS